MKCKVLNMATHRIILASIVCISLTVFAGQTLSQKRVSHVPPKWLPGMSRDEYKKELDKWMWQKRENSKEYINLMAREAWKRLLRIIEQQWKVIEPKCEKVQDLFLQSNVGAAGGGSSEESFHWNRPSESAFHPMEGKTRDQMTEVYRIVEELIDLLEGEKSKDEEIRKKIEDLQQAREKARKECDKVRRELAPLLKTARQEAIFLIMGYID